MMRFAVLIDGEFMRYRMQEKSGQFPEREDFETFCTGLVARYHSASEGYAAGKPAPPRGASHLYRIFFYTANPEVEDSRHAPTDVEPARRLIADLERESNVAVRRGTLTFRGWKLRPGVIKREVPADKSIKIQGSKIKRNFKQKGVDMLIGLDIATLALKRLVSDIVVVTGDLDIVPAFKLARTEGLRVYVDMMGSESVSEKLRIHSDCVLG